MNRQAVDISQFSKYFAEYSKPITLEAIRRYFRQVNPGIADSTVNWHAHELVKASVLERIGRGLFKLGEGKDYCPAITELETQVIGRIRKDFPLISFCVWNSGIINEFAQHLSGYPFILVDVEREVSESVYLKLKEHFAPVFYRLNQKLLNDLLPDFENPIVVRNLVTESPLNENDGLPVISLEKLLVDLLSDDEFTYLEGSELRAIYRNAFYKYTVNENRLLRYAARKGRKSEVKEFICSHDFTQSHQ